MTVDQAKRILRPPLIFGNEVQIAAVHVIEALESGEPEEEKPCPECHGSGEIECDHCGSIVACEECDGSGTLPDLRGYVVHIDDDRQLRLREAA
jgi:hypothetical protein